MARTSKIELTWEPPRFWSLKVLRRLRQCDAARRRLRKSPLRAISTLESAVMRTHKAIAGVV
jgi:hypothetical protein